MTLAVSIVGGLADNTRLFEYAKEYIDNLKSEYNVIVSGRALMEIYPKQDYHIFITADLEERVKRKCIQYNGYELEKVKCMDMFPNTPHVETIVKLIKK